MLTRERLSHVELLNLTNRKHTLSHHEVEEMEDRYGVFLSEEKKTFDLGNVGVGFAGLGVALVGGTLLYACSSVLYTVGFTDMTFHLHLNEAWSHFKLETAPALFHHIFLFLKGSALGMLGIGVHKTIQACVQTKKEGPTIKINGKPLK